MKLNLSIVQEGYDADTCWTQSRLGISGDAWVLTTQRLTLSGSDVYGLLHSRYSQDGGKRFSPLAPQAALELPHRTFVDCTPQYHAPSGHLLCFGQSMAYKGTHPMHPEFDEVPRTYWTRYDAHAHAWLPLNPLYDLEGKIVDNTNAGCAQRLDLPDGDILLPLYRRRWDIADRRVTYVQVLRLRYDGERMVCVEQSPEIHRDEEPRGLAEPSLSEYHGRYYLTLRSDTKGYVAVSEDGLHYSKPKPWLWDSGEPLPNYNTQQHWVRGGDKLYLCYTRRDGKNDHVFRNRAPLYLAEVDVSAPCVRRHTELAITPERGARMGNFGVTELSDRRSVVVSTEWMQPAGCERFGSNNAIFFSDLTWEEGGGAAR